MKPWNIILFFTICLQLSAYIIAQVVVMPTNVNYEFGDYATQHGATLVEEYTIDRTSSEFNMGGDTPVSTITDYASSGIFAVSAITFILGAIASIFWMYPVLEGILHIPPVWSGVIQVMIYIIYAVGFFSWLSGKHPDATL